MISLNLVISNKNNKKENVNVLTFDYLHLEKLWNGEGIFFILEDNKEFFGYATVHTKVKEEDTNLKDVILEINRNTILKLNAKLNFLENPRKYPKKGFIEETKDGFKQTIAMDGLYHELIYKKSKTICPTNTLLSECFAELKKYINEYRTLLLFNCNTKDIEKGNVGTTYVESMPLDILKEEIETL